MMAMILGAILFLLYFTPTLLAIHRQHRNGGPIVVVNLLLGWTFIGWVIALAWACSDNTAKA